MFSANQFFFIHLIKKSNISLRENTTYQHCHLYSHSKFPWHVALHHLEMMDHQTGEDKKQEQGPKN